MARMQQTNFARHAEWQLRRMREHMHSMWPQKIISGIDFVSALFLDLAFWQQGPKHEQIHYVTFRARSQEVEHQA